MDTLRLLAMGILAQCAGNVGTHFVYTCKLLPLPTPVWLWFVSVLGRVILVLGCRRAGVGVGRLRVMPNT